MCLVPGSGSHGTPGLKSPRTRKEGGQGASILTLCALSSLGGADGRRDWLAPWDQRVGSLGVWESIVALQLPSYVAAWATCALPGQF